MTTGALIISWGRVLPGREKKALEVFASTQEYWEGNEKRGEIVSHRPYFGPLRGATGMFFIEGETERLQALMRTDEFRKEILRMPRSWLESAYNLVRYTRFDRGGHFAAMEEPDLFVDDVRAFFRGLR